MRRDSFEEGPILFVHDYPPLSGGGLAMHVLESAEALSGTYEVRIISSRLNDEFADDRSHIRSSFPRIHVTGISPLEVMGFLRQLRAARTVVCCTTYSLRPLSFLTLLSGRRILEKAIVVIHTEPAHMRYNRFSWLPLHLQSGIVRLHDALCRRAKLTTTFSEAEKKRLQLGGNDRVEFLPMLMRFPSVYREIYEEKMSSSAIRAVIGFSGEFSLLKGFDRVLRLADRLPADITILVAGDGPLRAQAEARVRVRPTGSAKMLSLAFVQPADMHVFYRSIDLLIIPSRSESLGRVAIEALMCGLDVVASPVGGLGEMCVRAAIQDSFADFDCAEGAALVVLRLLASNDGRPTRAKSARSHVEAFYSHVEERWLDLIRPISPG